MMKNCAVSEAAYFPGAGKLAANFSFQTDEFANSAHNLQIFVLSQGTVQGFMGICDLSSSAKASYQSFFDYER